ncbi:MAG: lipopolysaccharide kinase [Porticoccaceae bacterium]|nr:MAG: lipopolysaccharide kinase [Porticoccaceae bacterium]
MKRQFFHLNAKYAEFFKARGLDNFEALWDVDAEIVDAPNLGRNGHSDVGVFSLKDPQTHIERSFYLKRQENYNCRTPRHPLRGIPLAMREWLNIRHLQKGGVLTMDISCVGRDRFGGEQGRSDRALLVTRALDEDYESMEQWLDRASLSPSDRLDGIRALGRLVGRMHSTGLRHGCLYPKHIFFSRTDCQDIRFIDLEKCKKIVSKSGGVKDLTALVRRAVDLISDDWRQLLEAYIETSPIRWDLPILEKAVIDRIEAKKLIEHG